MIAIWQLGLVILIVWYLVFEYWWPPELSLSLKGDEELYTATAAFLEPQFFKPLIALITSHAGASSLVRKLETSKERGSSCGDTNVLLRFNTFGLRNYCNAPAVKPLCHLLDRIRVGEANAWVIKAYVALPTNYSSSSSLFQRELALQAGGALNLKDNKYVWVPHEVDILDLEVPSGMSGGELEVYDDDRVRERNPKTVERDGAAHIRPPKPNTLHAIRGSSYWSWTDFGGGGGGGACR